MRYIHQFKKNVYEKYLPNIGGGSMGAVGAPARANI